MGGRVGLGYASAARSAFRGYFLPLVLNIIYETLRVKKYPLNSHVTHETPWTLEANGGLYDVYVSAGLS